ncbi:MAG: heme-binding protein [Limnohabitans sp.]
MSNKWNFKAPMARGIAPRQAHALVPEGLWERELARNAFFGASTHFYHRNPPTAWSSIDKQGPHPHRVDTRHDIPSSASPWDATELASNANVRIRFWKTSDSMDHLVRNADGDELLFIHAGDCELFCDFGHISLTKGDYFILPRGTMWRIEVQANVEVLLIESTDAPYRLPEGSMLGRHLPFDSGVFDVPAIDEPFRAQATERPTKVRIKHGGKLSNLEYPFNPLDAEGWQGDLYPIRLNVRDIRSISSHRAEVVPSGHITFLSDRFHVCTAMPTPPPTDPSVLKMPSFRDSVEFDQVLFVHDGHPDAQPFGLETGLLTLDPRGVTHGPQPHLLQLFQDEGASAAAHQCSLIMLNVRDPLTVAQDSAGQLAIAARVPAEDSQSEDRSSPDALLLNQRNLSNELASRLMAGAVAKAREMGVPMSIAICDSAGNMVQFQRMDHASLLSVGIAQDKAYSSAATSMPTHGLHEFMKNDPPLAAGFVHTPRLVVFGGGYPVMIDGVLVGAIGVSGGHYSQDMEVAQAALEAAGIN